MSKSKGKAGQVLPPALKKRHQKRFEALRSAVGDNAIALVSSIDKATGRPVALICSVSTETRDGERMWNLTPLARILDQKEEDLDAAFVSPVGEDGEPRPDAVVTSGDSQPGG